IKQLLSARDLLVKQKAALKNANRSYSFEVVHVKLISQTFNKTIFYLENKIAAIDKELDIRSFTLH
ncbi:MAG: hypothetical protein LBF97_07440, partial [Elusimicrobiota bacterium]|nr:hypothetical protein [Elusimicrobiota bacterium]